MSKMLGVLDHLSKLREPTFFVEPVRCSIGSRPDRAETRASTYGCDAMYAVTHSLAITSNVSGSESERATLRWAS